MLRNIAGGLRSLFRKHQVERELDEELRAYLAMAVDEKIEQGMTREDALRAVRLEQGSLEGAKETVRAAPWESILETFWQDVRFGFRALRKSPGFTAVAVLTLALGIGANTAIFTLIYAVMLKPLPVPNPTQLYRLGDNNNCCVMRGTQNGNSFVLFSHPLYKDLRDGTPDFTELAAFESYLSILGVRRPGDSVADTFTGEFVSGNYFTMFGISAFTGRLFAPPDDSSGALRVAVMNYHTWQQRFGRDPAVIGSTFDINGVPYTITGVTPPRFYGDTLRSDPPDFWLPLADEPNGWLDNASVEWLYLLGRLQPGAPPTRVQARLTVELQQWLNSRPEVIPERDRGDIPKQHIRLTPAGLGVEQLQTDYAVGLRLLVTLSGLLLLIACANIANLLLARGSANRSRTAVRLALGAPRRRLIQQMLTESVLLSITGGAAGLYVAYAGTHVILLLAFRGAHYIPIEASPSLPILGFALLLSFVTGVLFGIAPAWMASHSNPSDALRGASPRTADRGPLVQRLLVTLQVAFSIVLLIGAGLVTQSLRNLEDQRFGFVTDGRLIININPSIADSTPDKLRGLYQRLEEALPKIPGVLSASLSGYSPLGGTNWNQRVYIDGKAPNYHWTAPSWDRVGPHYFETIGTRLLQGRPIDERDTAAAPHVVVINETFARRFFPNENPIGQHFGMHDASHSRDYEIVGIVEDAKYHDTRGPAYATFFLPLLQAVPADGGGANSIELHVAGRPENIEPIVRKTLADVDPNLTVLSMTSFGEQVARNFNQERLIARLTELFGGLALVLACVGLYGVTSYTVSRRTNEIGIRMALGASRINVVGLALRSVLLQLGVGLAIGIPLSLAGGHLLARQLYGVQIYDPLILGAVTVILVFFGLLATSVPARRATKVDPLVALRHE